MRARTPECGWEEDARCDACSGVICRSLEGTPRRAALYLGGLCVCRAVLCTASLVGIQQDGPAVHEHGVGLIHRQQYGERVLAAVARPPAEDSTKVIPWDTSRHRASVHIHPPISWVQTPPQGQPAQASAKAAQEGVDPEAPSSAARLTPPVPRGRMATEGSGQASRYRVSSRAPSTQPTVPSPPHTSTRKQGTWENRWSLAGDRKCPPPAAGAAHPPPRLPLPFQVPVLAMWRTSRSQHGIPVELLPAGTAVAASWGPSRPCCCPGPGVPLDSPGKRTSVGQVEDLMRVQ